MKNIKILGKLKEALVSVLPVTLLILLFNFIFDPMETGDLINFLVGAALLIVGMSLYTLGSETSIEPVGGMIGSRVTQTRKLPLILFVCFVIGVIVTIAEPDLTVLATQVAAIPNAVLIGVVAVGVGLFMLIATLRIVLKIELKWVLLFFYAVMFVLAAFVPADFLPLAFDSGGVTTGPITVPFIMAFGIGISSVLGGKQSQDSSFGMIGISSIGPIIAVLILGMFFHPEVTESSSQTLTFVQAFPEYLKEVALALAPIVLFFLLFDLISLRLPFKTLAKILVGILYTYLGLTLFLTGANVGFLPAGSHIGAAIVGTNKWILIPIGALIGAVLILAEPAVHVLNKQVEEITDGIIKRKTMLAVLSVSMAVAIALSMLRVVTGISIWWIILPGYAIALGLTFFVPKVFTGIAFDSGGVALGAMTAAFLLPFAMGATEAVGGSIMTDAFGVVAFVAMTPLVSIQILGLVYRLRTIKSGRAAQEFAAMLAAEGQVIELTSAPDDLRRPHVHAPKLNELREKRKAQIRKLQEKRKVQIRKLQGKFKRRDGNRPSGGKQE